MIVMGTVARSGSQTALGSRGEGTAVQSTPQGPTKTHLHKQIRQIKHIDGNILV